jgi:hypothetical protein
VSRSAINISPFRHRVAHEDIDAVILGSSLSLAEVLNSDGSDSETVHIIPATRSFVSGL